MQKIIIAVIGRTAYKQKIKQVIEKVEDVVMIGHATNVEEGSEHIRSAHVILLDVALLSNVKDTTLEKVLKIKPVPVIIMTDGSVIQSKKTVRAISNGAVDSINMSEYVLEKNREQFKNNVIEKLFHASSMNIRIPSSEKNSKELNRLELKENKQIDRRSMAKNKKTIIAIGSSTGGPRALQQLLSDIPKGFKTPILIVQHMPSRFTKSLADRLNHLSNIRVKEAVQGEVIENGTAYIAPGNYHMRVEQKSNKLIIKLSQEEARLGHRPSVNVLLDSIAIMNNTHKIVVILTGMGRDGADGVLAIKKSQKDAVIIAESHETAVINGMPNATIETNCVTEVLRIENIAKALVEYTNTRGY